MKKCGENFSDFVWSFVNHQPIINDVPDISVVPARTERSKAMSKSVEENVVLSLLGKRRVMPLCNLWG